MKNKLYVLGSVILASAPVVAFAQSSSCATANNTDGASVSGILAALCRIQTILNAVVPVLVALGVLYFIWGVVIYVISSDEEAKKTGRDRIIYGVIGLAVIVSLWGLVRILTNTFGLDNANTSTPINLPSVPVR